MICRGASSRRFGLCPEVFPLSIPVSRSRPLSSSRKTRARALTRTRDTRGVVIAASGRETSTTTTLAIGTATIPGATSATAITPRGGSDSNCAPRQGRRYRRGRRHLRHRRRLPHCVALLFFALAPRPPGRPGANDSRANPRPRGILKTFRAGMDMRKEADSILFPVAAPTRKRDE